MHAVQFYQIKSVKAGGGIEQQQPGDNEAAARHEVQGQLHGGVFLPGGPPDQDQDIHGNHGDFIEQEEKEQIHGHENAENTGDQEQYKDEKFLNPVFQFPHGEHAGKNHNAGEQQHGGVEAVHADEIGDAEAFHPFVFFHKLQAPQIFIVGGEGVNGKTQRNCRRHQGRGPDEKFLLLFEKQDDGDTDYRRQHHTGQIRKIRQMLHHKKPS